MMKKIILIAALSVLILQGTALAFESDGEIVFRDSMYGAAVGAILGGAIYLADQNNFAAKFATGVIAGTVGGLVFGVYETSALVEIEKDKVRFAMPTPVLNKQGKDIQYSASLFKSRF